MSVMTSEDFRQTLADIFINDPHAEAKYQGYDSDLQRKTIRFESATLNPTPTATFLMTVEDAHCQVFGTLHGGCIASIMDTTSSIMMASLARPGFWNNSFGGVSRNLDVRYLRPVPKGRTVRITVKVVHAGKRSALINIEVTDARTGELCVIAEHDKVNFVSSSL